MKKIMMIFFVINFVLIAAVFAYASSQDGGQNAAQSGNNGLSLPLMAKYLGAALAMAGATFSSGLAVGRIGAAAMGAVSEKPETAGTAMILVALAEGVSLWGIAGAFIILTLG